MEISVSAAILDFLTGIHVKRDAHNRRQAIFDEAYRKAYGDMWTHTGEYKPLPEYIGNGKNKTNESFVIRYNKRAIREAIKEHIKKDFTDLGSKDEAGFKKWHETLCKKIVDIGTVEVELLENISANKDAFNKGKKANKEIENVKKLGEYEFAKKVLERETDLKKKTFQISDIICHTKLDNTTFSCGQAQKLVNMMLKYLYIYCNCEGISDLNKVVQYFHCPLDSYVLQAAFDEKESEHTLPWSQLTEYEEYKTLQDEISKRIRKQGEYETAFKWELAEWPFS